jgi:hypothetical protein
MDDMSFATASHGDFSGTKPTPTHFRFSTPSCHRTARSSTAGSRPLFSFDALQALWRPRLFGDTLEKTHPRKGPQKRTPEKDPRKGP